MTTYDQISKAMEGVFKSGGQVEEMHILIEPGQYEVIKRVDELTNLCTPQGLGMLFPALRKSREPH